MWIVRTVWSDEFLRLTVTLHAYALPPFPKHIPNPQDRAPPDSNTGSTERLELPKDLHPPFHHPVYPISRFLIYFRTILLFYYLILVVAT